MPVTPAPPSGKVIIILGHPGHEVRIHHWIERLQPAVIFLTDGSGGTGVDRTASSRRLLLRAGASVLPIPPIPDKTLYAEMLSGNPVALTRWIRAADTAVREFSPDCIIGDAAEGFSPTHDLCRAITRMLTLRHPGTRGYAYWLEGNPAQNPAPGTDLAHRLALPEDAFARKIAAVAEYTELAYEAERAYRAYGQNAFANEWIFEDTAALIPPADAPKPAYERFGESRVTDGKYDHIIRYADHVRPLVERLPQLL